MTPELKVTDLLLAKITPSLTNPRKMVPADTLHDLSVSIKTNGVISPIRVRKIIHEAFEYEIIYGERRYLASYRAERLSIPAIIVEATDEQVEQMQFVENMNREDVHPMDEAAKFADMLKREKPYTLEDIMAMINKSASYIMQRLELMNLIPVLQKDFKALLFNFQVAILFARLKQSEQKDILKTFKTHHGGNYGSAKQLRDMIERSITRDLSKVPWSLKDQALYEKAGACVDCPKRSGANVLFENWGSKNTCFDKACFDIKATNHVLQTIEKVHAEHPDVIFMCGYYSDPIPVVEKFMAKHQIPFQKAGSSGYTRYKEAGCEAVKVLYISGDEVGKHGTMYKAGSKSKKADVKELKAKGVSKEVMIKALDENIGSIKERESRAKELDGEKIWTNIYEKVLFLPDLLTEDELTPLEAAAMIYAMCSGLQNQREAIKAILKMDLPDRYSSKSHEAVLKKLIDQLDRATALKLTRLYIIHTLKSASGSHLSHFPHFLLKKMAERHVNVKPLVVLIEEEQAAIADKRKGRVADRIKALEKEKKLVPADALKNGKKAAPEKKEDAPAKKSTPAKKKSPAKKKAAPKKKEVIPAQDDDDFEDEEDDLTGPYEHSPMREHDDDEDDEFDGGIGMEEEQ